MMPSPARTPTHGPGDGSGLLADGAANADAHTSAGGQGSHGARGGAITGL